MIPVQYPYELWVLSMTDTGQDGNGNSLPPASTWSRLCNCRDEAGNGKLIRTADGNVTAFSFLLQMPFGAPAISAGTKIKVLDAEGGVRCTGMIIYSRKDQLHTRAWV